MTRLTPSQIAGYAKGAGFSGANVAIAVAVALAESGGRTDALNTSNSDGSVDHGLWQINSVHADLLASGSWQNPADNARMAYRVWKSSGWDAWTTYNSGAYLSHLGNARKVAGSATATTASAVKSDLPFPVEQLQTQLKNHIKLTPTQRSKILAYIVKYNKSAEVQNQVGPVDAKTPDDKLVAYYVLAAKEAEVGGGVTGKLPGDPLGGISDLISFITNADNWRRVAFFLVGALLILISLFKISAGSIPLPGAAGAIAKVIGK